ncbi:hypothetical protein [Alteribacillus iranensis]|uniref:hypothetical protein n=1 Tax=Alteribacillus iranensis TaxID=930128 RepID=UPI0015A5865C|nr:hypothetical protein [Alteribacillus iranensis]
MIDLETETQTIPPEGERTLLIKGEVIKEFKEIKIFFYHTNVMKEQKLLNKQCR